MSNEIIVHFQPTTQTTTVRPTASPSFEVKQVPAPVNGHTVVAGPPGPPGPPGLPGIALAHVHLQSSAVMIWTINHNLGFQPNIELRDTGGNKLMAQILHVSLNQTLVYFNLPTAGTARCN